MPYDVVKDPYLDASTGILRNLLGYRTQSALDAAEAEITAFEMGAMLDESALLPIVFDGKLLQDVHKQIFQDIYDWAGELRTVEISKGSTSFARVAYLIPSMQSLFDELQKDTALQNDFVAQLAYYYAELIVLHPFREGNGRTIRTFLSLLAKAHGYYIAWGEMDPQSNLEASIAAYQGDETPMYDMLEAITRPE